MSDNLRLLNNAIEQEIADSKERGRSVIASTLALSLVMRYPGTGLTITEVKAMIHKAQDGIAAQTSAADEHLGIQ